MKPRSKRQKRIVRLSNDMGYFYLAPKILDWAKEHAIPHYGIVYPSGKAHCLTCGHQWKNFDQGWQSEIADTECPSCKRKLEMKGTRKRTKYAYTYFGVLTKKEEFQVLKHYRFAVNLKVGQKPQYFWHEVQRLFVDTDGKVDYVGEYKASYWTDRWGGSMEFRPRHSISKNEVVPDKYYPRNTLSNAVKQRGYVLNDDYNVFAMIQKLLLNPKAETLYKAGYEDLVSRLSFDPEYRDWRFWPTFKILIRNKYKIKNASDYIDMLGALEYLEKDLRNAHFVCPTNEKKAHNYWINRKAREMKRREYVKKKQDAISEEAKYKLKINRYKHLKFVKDNIEIVPLKTVNDFVYYGEIFHHCLFTMEYYKRKNSLLMVATVNDKPMESIEIDLNRFKVLQSRGLNNEPSKFHEQIVSLVEENMALIKKAKVGRQRKSKRKLKIQKAA